MRYLSFALLPLLVVGACGGSENENGNTSDDACILGSDGQYSCAGRTWPRCEGNASSGQACEKRDELCMACKDNVAAVVCSCGDPDGGAAAVWVCRGTGRGCR